MAKEYKVAGITHYIDNLMGIAYENSDYNLSSSEIKESFSDGDKIDKYDYDFKVARLVEEPDNPMDPKAIRVELDGVLIGYVKSGSCSEIRSKMHSENYKGIIITELHYGEYKHVYEDEDGKLHVEKGKYEYPFARFEVLEKVDIPEKKPQLAQEPVSVTAPEQKPLDPKTKSSALSSVVLIAAIIMMFIALPIGLILLVVGLVLFFKSRRQ